MAAFHDNAVDEHRNPYGDNQRADEAFVQHYGYGNHN
jgi:hypothetical protein